MYVSDTLPCKRLFHYESPDHEALWLQIKTNALDIILCSAYWPPDDHSDLLTHITTVISNHPFKYNTCFILLGDLNAHNSVWPYSHTTNHHGRLLQNFLMENDFDQLVNKPTRISNRSSSTLDIFITNTPELVDSVYVQPPIGSSDHAVVCTNIPALSSDPQPTGSLHGHYEQCNQKIPTPTLRSNLVNE